MKYCARYNTADPKIGFVSVGEVLTDKQAEALGKEKIDELVKDGLLIAVGGTPEAEPHTPAQEEAGEDEAEEQGQTEADPDELDGDGEDEEDEDAEIPVGDDMDDIVPGDEADKPEAAADSKRGRRKKANEGKDSGNGQD